MRETPNRATRKDPPPTLARRYWLVRMDGVVDGTAAVLAWDTRLKRWRTIQIARLGDDTAARRLLAAAQQAAKLEHPALERVIDMDTDGGVTFVVRDRLLGSAEEHLKRHGAVAPAWAARVVARLAEGLEWAHTRGVVHGQPRPEVVRFAEDGTAVLTGFGRAGAVEEKTRERAVAHFAHQAPELRQRWHPTPQTDIYALGALMYTLLAGRHSADLFYAEAHEGLLAPVPPVMRPLLERACAYEPSDRFNTAAELHEALLTCLGELNTPEAAPPWLADAPALPQKAPAAIAMDPLLIEIAKALGSRPTGRAVPIDDERSGATLDRETGQPLPYVMPTIQAKDPGFRDPFEEISESDLPDYVDRSVELWRRKGLEQVVIREDGSVPAAPVRTEANTEDGKRQPARLTVAVLAGVLAITVLLGGGGLAWYVGTAPPPAEQTFADLVEAESATIGSLAAGDTELEAAWFAFVDARGDARDEAAASLVHLLEERAGAALLPSVADASVERLKRARDRWEADR